MNYSDLPVKRKEKVKLTVTMDVTAPQAYALIEMFRDWKFCGQAGCSRAIGFYVDGDGDFQPNCVIKTEPELPELPDEQKKLTYTDYLYDYDALSYDLRLPEDR